MERYNACNDVSYVTLKIEWKQVVGKELVAFEYLQPNDLCGVENLGLHESKTRRQYLCNYCLALVNS